MSLGAISKIEQQTSVALAGRVEEAREHVRQQAVANADEIDWFEGKSGGRKQRAWLWVVTTSLVTVFKIAKSRGEDVAREMLGDGFQGVLGADRWSAYNRMKGRHPRHGGGGPGTQARSPAGRDP